VALVPQSDCFARLGAEGLPGALSVLRGRGPLMLVVAAAMIAFGLILDQVERPILSAFKRD